MSEIHKDPVCEMHVLNGQATARSEYKGETYYFCSPVCKRIFDSDPGKYSGEKREEA